MILRIVNSVILLLLVAVLGLVYWFGVRPLPRTSGSIAATVSGSVKIVRDAQGVPHISAGTREDMLFAQGYALAQDRLFQMDSIRRLAAGDLAEIVGQGAVESDRDSRRLRLRRLAEQQYAAMAPADRADFAAYARGVNEFIRTHQATLPLEFTLLSYSPRPWSVVDSILVGLQMYLDLTTGWKDDIAKRTMLTGGDAAKVTSLFARAGKEELPGSNGWAISGKHTASGKPLLASDMHLELKLPSIWYEAHLQAPGLNVAGVTVPGLPGIIVGHNDRIAWGITNLGFDVQDLYVEQFDERSGRYQFKGQAQQARLEREFIRVKGAPPVELAVWVTQHGPIFLGEGEERMSLRWSAAEADGFHYPFLDIDAARNWQEFTTALKKLWGPGSNLVYADVDGNIGYHAAGKLPIRRNFDGDVPLDGASGQFEWDGYIPFDELPSAFNPPSGLIVSANQNPFPANYPYRVNGGFSTYYRAKQIRDMLSARQGWKAADMLAVQKDVYSSFSHFLAKQIVASCDRRKVSNPALTDAVTLMRNWDGQMDRDGAAPLLLALTYGNLRRMVAERASPGKAASYVTQSATAVIEKLLREKPAGWFDDYDELLLRALLDGVEEGRRMQGKNVKKWTYGDYLRPVLNNPVLHQLPLLGYIPYLGRYVDIGPVRMSGGPTSVKQTSIRLAPSMRMNADLGSWDDSLLNIPIGQSGQVLSGHYRDQWDRYYVGQSFPMQFGKVEARQTLELTPNAR